MKKKQSRKTATQVFLENQVGLLPKVTMFQGIAIVGIPGVTEDIWVMRDGQIYKFSLPKKLKAKE